MDKFDIVSIPAETFILDKQLDGAIPKGWIKTSHGEALFKIASSSSYYPEVRTDWSEKIVAELADRLQLPTARYELAQIESLDGAISGSISLALADGEGKRFSLEELLEGSIDNYDIGNDYEVSKVIGALEDSDIKLPPNYELPEGIEDGADMFVGALMLDAFTCNIDRHHKNFDFIYLEDGTTYLSPVFDYGRSLGSFINDEVKENRSIQGYSESSKSSISVDGFQVNGLEVFAQAAKLRPQAAQIWLQELSKINPEQLRELFDRIPEEIITPVSKKFAVDLLNHNQSQLLSLNLEYKLTEQQRLETINVERIKYNELAQKATAELGTLNQFQLDLEIYHQASLTTDKINSEKILQHSDRYRQLATENPELAKNYLSAIANVSSTYKQLPENTTSLDFWAKRLVDSDLAKQKVKRETESSLSRNNEAQRQEELEP